MGVSWFTTHLLGILVGNTLNYATTVFFHILLNLLFAVIKSLDAVGFELLTASLNRKTETWCSLEVI
jgi:hypothetical protein